jgi:hypothetical protein
MSKSFPNLTNTPPGGWRYLVPETGKVIGPFSGWRQLEDNLVAYYHSTAYPLPDNLFDLAQAYICGEQPEYCGEPAKESGVAKFYRESKHTFHTALQCLTTLVSHRAGSGERPSLEQQEARAAVCVECPMNQDTQACSVCNIKTLNGLIKKLAGAKVTSYDKRLKFCAVCHCANAAKIATKLEAIWTHMPQSQREKLPPACWLVTEQADKEAKYGS